MEIITEHPNFFTATIHEWEPLLDNNKYKRIIIESLEFMVRDSRIILYAFVIMNNHLHLIWQMREGHALQNVQRDFLKFTAQKIRFDLLDHNPDLLSRFEVNLKDRKYRIWQRNPMSIELYSSSVFDQKLDYIHENPVRAGICDTAEEYQYSCLLSDGLQQLSVPHAL